MLTYDALPDERQKYIREMLIQMGRVLAIDLSAKFDVSIHTIRRDLVDLAEAGVCKRVYGGAIALASDGGSLHKRAGQQSERKDALARAAVKLLSSGQCIFIDAGSTNLAIAKAIGTGTRLTIVTNSPTVADTLLDNDSVDIIVLGGQIDQEVGGTVGTSAVEAVQRLSFDLAFLGTCAIDHAEGLTVFNHEDAYFKRAVISRSDAVTMVVLNEKIASVARHKVAALDAVSSIVVESDAPRARLASFEDSGIEVIISEKN
ncbi:transcriptional regulator [Caballeronia udeis]|uniref:Transcriptional regulator n=1 Tax=Caballeronia udeis TaxID=1232866 RepID=A0A158IBN1_9BURK|nr:DeoR/GlpR family DNA-binding transcription regulator [Caballeronia udeis]SAL53867.1 transcriptional regulator [Caballeronia udeis]